MNDRPTLSFVLGGLAALYCTWLIREYALDDAFITYGYARNLAEGNGFEFQPGPAVLGTSTPGYTVLLAVVHHATGIELPLISRVITVGCLATSALLLHAILAPRFGTAPALLGAIMLATNPVVHLSIGMEASLNLMLILLILHMSVRNCAAVWIGVAWGMSILVRLESVLLGLIPLIIDWRLPNRQRRFATIASTAGLLLAPWLVFAVSTFGSALPNSMGAKQQLYDVLPQMAAHRVFVRGAFEIPRWLVGVNPALLAIAPAVAWGLIRVTGNPPIWLKALLVWTVFYVVAFEWVDLPNVAIWYWVPLQIALVVFAVAGVDGMATRVFSNTGSRNLAIGFAALLFAGSQVSTLRSATTTNRASAYKALGEAIACKQPYDATIATWEIGIIGYYSRCEILDFVGIVTPTSVGHDPEELIKRDAPLWVVSLAPEGYARSTNIDKVPNDLLLFRRAVGEPDSN